MNRVWMRPSLIRSLACLAALALAVLPSHAWPQDAGAPALTVTVASDGAIRATGVAPSGFPLSELRSRVPGIAITATSGGEAKGEARAWAPLLDALSVVLPRLARGEARVGPSLLAIDGTLRPGFSAEATRGAVRLALGSEWETRLTIAEAPPTAALAVTWSRHGAVVSGILPEGLAPSEALALVGGPLEGMVDGGLVDAGLTGGGAGDVAAWRAALERVGRLLPAYRHAVVRLKPGTLSVDGALAPGHEAERLQRWLAAGLGEGWTVSASGAERPATEGAIRLDPVGDGPQERVRGRWIPLHAFAPRPAGCGRHSSAVLADGPLSFAPGRTELVQGAAESLDRLAGIARRCLNQGGLALEIGGHTDSIGTDEENISLSEKRAMKVLLELVARGVRADAMRAVGHGETRAVTGNDTPEGRARNRRVTFAWSE